MDLTSAYGWSGPQNLLSSNNWNEGRQRTQRGYARGRGPAVVLTLSSGGPQSPHLCPERLSSLSSSAALSEKVRNGRGGRGNRQSPACVKAEEADCWIQSRIASRETAAWEGLGHHCRGLKWSIRCQTRLDLAGEGLAEWAGPGAGPLRKASLGDSWDPDPIAVLLEMIFSLSPSPRCS